MTSIDAPYPRAGFMRVKEFMAYSRLGRSKVYQLMAERHLESVKVGRCRLIPNSAIETWEKGLVTADCGRAR